MDAIRPSSISANQKQELVIRIQMFDISEQGGAGRSRAEQGGAGRSRAEQGHRTESPSGCGYGSHMQSHAYATIRGTNWTGRIFNPFVALGKRRCQSTFHAVATHSGSCRA